jgi:transglutaminase-like putative cysteine protease
VQTRNRAVDWAGKQACHRRPGRAARSTSQPTELLPVDGIVRKTALEATRGARTDVEKVRALYNWVVANAYREPKTRGCGTGDIKAMLETGNLGGKCADLNAMFVGLCRARPACPRATSTACAWRPRPSATASSAATRPTSRARSTAAPRSTCRQHGWVAMDPADVLKVMRQETPSGSRTCRDPLVAPVMKGLFGGWEGNWVAWNTAHDIRCPAAPPRARCPS